MESFDSPPREVWLDLDATDDPLHGDQEGRFFHGYYRCYCYLPLYIFCGGHLLCSRLRTSGQDGAAGSVDELGRIVKRLRRRHPRPAGAQCLSHRAEGRIHAKSQRQRKEITKSPVIISKPRCYAPTGWQLCLDQVAALKWTRWQHSVEYDR